MICDLHTCFQKQKKEIVWRIFLLLLMVQKSQTTTWDVSNLVNNGINYQAQLVFSPDFSSPKMDWKPLPQGRSHLSSDHSWPPLVICCRGWNATQVYIYIYIGIIAQTIIYIIYKDPVFNQSGFHGMSGGFWTFSICWRSFLLNREKTVSRKSAQRTVVSCFGWRLRKVHDSRRQNQLRAARGSTSGSLVDAKKRIWLKIIGPQMTSFECFFFFPNLEL